MNTKFKNWENLYTFDNCGVGRKAHGEFLMSYITGEHDGFVLNLNGEWGSGKTEFLRRMRSGLIENGYPVIYIDAWESDFCGAPLLVVASELLEQLKSYFDVTGDDLDKVKEWIGRFTKSAVVGSAGYLSKKFVDDASLGISAVKELMNQDAKDYLDHIKAGYLEQISAIGNVRGELGKLTESLERNGKKLPVVVLIDELDRCRPNYAIEMLEVVKHFFTTTNFVFVVSTDTSQLQESIKSVYGYNFDSQQYLRRFFNREARLIEPDIKAFVNRYEFDIPSSLRIYPVEMDDLLPDDSIRQYLCWAAKAYNLQLRDIDQTAAKLKACLRVISNNNNIEAPQTVNVFTLIVAIIEYEKQPKIFENRSYLNPYEKWESQDFTLTEQGVDSPTNFSDFYELNIESSVKGNLWTTLGPERSIGHKGGTMTIFKENSEYIQATHNSITRVSNYVTTNGKKWLWSDYKQIVTLAFTLS